MPYCKQSWYLLQRHQLLLIKSKYNVTVLSVAVPSLNLIVLQGRMERSVLSYLFLSDSNTFPVDIVIKWCNFRGWISHGCVRHLSWKCGKCKGRINLVLEAFPPNNYEILVLVVCLKELLIEVNRLVIFVSWMSEDSLYFDSSTLLGREGGGDQGKVKKGMDRSHFSGGKRVD